MRRYRRHYTDEELLFIANHLKVWRVAVIARHLGRTEAGVRRACWNRHYRPTNQDWITSGDAQEITGYSQQYLNRLARLKRIRARRIPGGRWWIFDPATLPKKRGGCG